jgi:hypothetical protein
MEEIDNREYAEYYVKGLIYYGKYEIYKKID